MNNKKHILVAVSGMTPQIITETLFGIYKKDKSQLPEKIEVITTQGGKDRLINNLLGEDSPLQRFIKDYQLAPIAFAANDIYVPLGDDKKALDDVRTVREQEIITDFITDHIRALSQDDNIAIHASLAGGRKTMGFALGYAMSLFGRPQDCLSHVLVSEPYESVPDFYYPTPTTVLRADFRKEAMHDLSKAEVILAEIPLVLMRQEMPSDLIEKPNLSYTQTVERINVANRINQETAKVELDFTRMSIRCDEQEILLKPDCFAFYSWLAKDSKENPKEGIEAPNTLPIKELDNRACDFFRAAISPLAKVATDIGSLRDSADDAAKDAVLQTPTLRRNSWIIQENKSNALFYDHTSNRKVEDVQKNHKNIWDRLLKETNTAIENALGKRLASYYQIQTVCEIKQGEHKRHKQQFKGINISPKNIIFA